MCKTRAAFHAYGNFWAKCKNPKWVSTLFRAIVINTSLSGWAAFAPSDADTNAIDKVIVPLARRALQGRARTAETVGPEQVKHRSWSNERVLRELGARPTAVELRTLRLKWWQTIVRKPDEYVQFLIIFFGSFPFEHCTRHCWQGDGQLGSHPHKWAKQLVKDLEVAADIAQSDELAAAARSPKLLFLDADVCDSFLRLDMRMLAATFNTVSIPPPGAVPAPPVPPPPAQVLDDELREVLRCDLQTAAGSVCGRTFLDKRALVAHQVHSTCGGEHGVPSLARQLARFNQCVACNAIHRHRGYTCAHPSEEPGPRALSHEVGEGLTHLQHGAY